MKIVYCLPQLFHPGGIERIVSIKANYLVENYGYNVTIIVANQKGKVPFYTINNNINIIDLGLDYDATLGLTILQRLKERKRLHKLHKQKLSEILLNIKPDITISTFTHEAAFLPMINDGSKKILEFHFCRGHKKILANSFRFPLVQKMLYYLRCWQEENIIVPKYDQFVVLTEEDKNLWKSKVNNVINIPNILSFESNKQATLEEKRAIAVGRLDNQKGFDKLIKMWSVIVQQCSDWELNIYGQGEDEYKLRALISDLNLDKSVFINKPEKNIQQKYLESSVFLMTSNFEGWGLVLTEAMQCGLPAVAFACKCGPKDIINNGVDGFCVPIDDDDQFIGRTIQIMKNDNLRRLMGHNACKNIQRYSIERVMPLWNQLFNQLMKRK